MTQRTQIDEEAMTDEEIAEMEAKTRALHAEFDRLLADHKPRRARTQIDEDAMHVPEQAGGWYGVAYAEGRLAGLREAAEMARATARNCYAASRHEGEMGSASGQEQLAWRAYEADHLAAAYEAKARGD